ncbi:MAG: hypothetical protein K2M81_02985 [Lachnospiraceae bacterium]|nr:hypothetical protein [Lachnospiraceae bacterium]
MITFEEIRADRHSLKEVEGIEGIYKVYLPEDIPFQLNKTTTAFEYDKKGRKLVYDSDEDIKRLLHQWELIQSAKEPDNRLVYIGKAVNLRKRLKQFAAYGVGKGGNHQGGKILWQLTDAIKFHIEYFPCENCRKEENESLKDYKKRHFNQLPIANEEE